LLKGVLEKENINLGLARHVLRQAGKYKISNLIGNILDKFDMLLPVVREIVVYFERVLDQNLVKEHEHQFKKILSSHYLKLPFVNIWVFTLFQIEHFNAIDLKIDYTLIIRHREQALIARREKNFAWLKSYKGKLDTIDPWGKRAIIYSLEALPEAEVVPWLNLEARKGDILTKCACLLVIGKKNKLANQHDGNSKPSRI
jgi:hypothetical protein